MRLKEQRFWDGARKQLSGYFWLQRVENVVGDGMPDVFVIGGHGRSCWVELKAVERPVKSSTRLLGTQGLRQSQKNWHTKAASFNIRSFVLIRDSHNELYLLSGEHADAMNDWTRDEVLEHCLIDAQRANPWTAIVEVLS